ncbi:hypothetical protein RND81_13G206300 [Saponaria officinalis]|uniref:Tetrapyrrole biosynthesis uroporphyrinogen III synthase domain-containing protein n=1 Tax=Saponaria officinalis TaxID=3572 RepID=A0AAW1H5M3_SAPOF
MMMMTPNLSPAHTVAFTTPSTYATRLSPLLHSRNWTPLWCPTVTVHPTSSTHSALIHHLQHLNQFSAIAFTSRSGISAFSSALSSSPPPSAAEFIIAALGNDAELLTPDFLSRLSPRVKLLIPSSPTPTGLVHSLGPGSGRRVLCPVPLVSDLHEPDVVPNFLNELESAGWVPVRVNAYETKWAGPRCAARMLETGRVDGLIFTSTAEVEGLLKSLGEYGMGFEDVRKRWAGLVVAAHGPVTAAGAESLGVKVDVVSSKFGSFEGVVDALDHFFTLGL